MEWESRAPCTLRLPSRRDRTRVDDYFEIGETHCLPFQRVETNLILFSSVVMGKNFPGERLLNIWGHQSWER